MSRAPISFLAFQAWMLLAASLALHAQTVPRAVVSDSTPDKEAPATIEAPDVPSHGASMHAVFYLASGPGPHPTVLLMHGFPGNEQNMDLAYSIRRAGWNVLVPHYRGSWGSEGTFSFGHAIEDTQAAVQFLREPASGKMYRIDPKRIVLVGHSMGGFMVAYAAGRDPEILAVAMMAAWNIGASMARPSTDGYRSFHTASPRLAGTTPEGLLAEARQNAANWNYLDYVPGLKNRPLLILEADDRNASDNQALAAALRKAGNSRVTEAHIAADHTFSDHRIALQGAVLEWLLRLDEQKPR